MIVCMCVCVCVCVCVCLRESLVGLCPQTPCLGAIAVKVVEKVFEISPLGTSGLVVIVGSDGWWLGVSVA
jgi:hypothetical protein